MPRSKRILWLSPVFTDFIESKSLQLEKHHFHCVWVPSLNILARELSEQRASIIIVSEGLNPEQSQDNILGLGTIVEAKGSRLLFSTRCKHHHLVRYAAAANFRDSVPEDLSDNLWLYRVLYASSGQAMDFPIPNAQITLDHPAHLYFPARIIWINSKEMRLECQMTPPIGTKLKLSGPLFSSADSGILFEIKKQSETRLTYRFSGALEGTWSAKSAVTAQILKTLKDKTSSGSKPKVRVFIAVKSKQLRRSIIREFTHEKFDCNSALQLKSLVTEPRFFTPNLLLIEDKLCCGPALGRFQEMLKLIDSHIPILIFGDNPQLAEIKASFKDKNVVLVGNNQADAIAHIKEKLLPKTDDHSEMGVDTAYLESDEPLSCVSLRIPGKLQAIHPLTGHVSCPYPVRSFSMFQLRSPFLNRWIDKDPWIKATQQNGTTTSHDVRQSHSVAGFFIDISAGEKKVLAHGLSAFIGKVLGIDQVETKSEKNVEFSEAKEPNSQESESFEREDDPSKLFDKAESATVNKPMDSAQASDKVLTMAKEESLPINDYLNEYSYLYQVREAFRGEKFRRLVIFFLIVGAIFIGLATLNSILPKLLKNYQNPGTIYIEQLKKYNASPR